VTPKPTLTESGFAEANERPQRGEVLEIVRRVFAGTQSLGGNEEL